MKGEKELRTRYPSLPQQPLGLILGIDECGIGCWAGPIVLCGVLAQYDFEIEGLRDSKAVSKKKHAELDGLVRERAKGICLVAGDNRDIDEVGVHRVKLHCMQRIVMEMEKKYGNNFITIVDGLDGPKGCYTLPKADDLIQHVSAASIVAKLAKDKSMAHAAELYPGYRFEINSGYGTKEHQEGLKKLGVTPIHRRSFRPIQELLKTKVQCVRIQGGNTQWTGPESALVIYQK